VGEVARAVQGWASVAGGTQRWLGAGCVCEASALRRPPCSLRDWRCGADRSLENYFGGLIKVNALDGRGSSDWYESAPGVGLLRFDKEANVSPKEDAETRDPQARSKIEMRKCQTLFRRSIGRSYNTQRDLRLILPAMMDRVVRNHAFRLIIVIAAGVQIAIEAGEVAARNLHTDAMARCEIVARHHGGHRQFVHFTVLHPDLLVEAIAVAGAEDRFIQVVRNAVGVNVNQFCSEVRVLGVGGNVKRHFDVSAHLEAFLQGLGRIYENVGARFHFPLIERATGDRVAGAADIAAVGWHRVHRIVSEAVGTI
jgi:hypothetical protein